jgi:hypothetical protein
MSQAFAWPFFLSTNRSTARIPHQSPVTSHYPHDGRAAWFGVVQISSAGSLMLRFAAEAVFRTLPEGGDTRKHCNDAKIAAQSGKSFHISCRFFATINGATYLYDGGTSNEFYS